MLPCSPFCPGCLRAAWRWLVGWRADELVLELRTFLDDVDLFSQLRRASRKAYRPQMLAPSLEPKRTMAQTFHVDADVRILRALCVMAGSTRFGSSFSGLEYLVVRQPLRLQATFDEGKIAHFTADDGSVWLGEDFRFVYTEAWELESQPWEVAVEQERIYLVFERAELIDGALREPGHVFFAPASGFGVAPAEQPSRVAWLLAHFHIEDWFRERATTQVAAEQVQPDPWYKGREPLWYEHDWLHPADALLSHLRQAHRPGVGDLLRLLGWTQQDIEQYHARARQLKQEAVARTLSDTRARAGELARPQLESFTIKQLIEIAQRHQLAVSRSVRKGELVSQLASQQAIAEKIIGLARRLAEQKERRG